MYKKFLTSSRGFTLVELLAVMFVFVAISSILMSIIVGALRGNNKTNAINSLQANGDYALSQMSKGIQNATTLLGPLACGSVDSPTATSAVELAYPDGTINTYNCLDDSGNASITSNSAALVDTNAVTVVSCQFTCGQDSPSDYPIIGIDFALQSHVVNTNLIDTKASSSAVEFQTAVVIRNLIR